MRAPRRRRRLWPSSSPPGYDRYAAGGQCHEAGYDAYMTGVVHAILRHSGACTDAACNTLYAMRSVWQLNLAGDDTLVDPKATVIHLSFAAEPRTTTADLLRLFDETWRVELRWVDATSALALVPLEHAVAAQTALGAAQPAVLALALDEWRARSAAAPSHPALAQAAAAPAPTAPAVPAAANEPTEPAAKRKRAAPAAAKKAKQPEERPLRRTRHSAE